MSNKEKLTPKREKFCKDIAYETFDFDYQAYEAHFSTANMSKNSIYTETFKLMQVPAVSLRIKELRAKKRAAEKVTLDEIIVKLSKRVNLDIREMFNDDNTFKNIKDLSQEQAMFLRDFEVITTYKGNEEEPFRIEVKKVKLETLKDMLDMLIKHYGGYAAEKSDAEKVLDSTRELINELRK